MIRVVGNVTRRRCFGKKLAFADILIEELYEWGQTEGGEDVIGVNDDVGSRTNSGNEEEDDNKRHAMIQLKETIQVVFRSDGADGRGVMCEDDVVNSTSTRNVEDTQKCDKFPTKNSELPYGSLVSLMLRLSSDLTLTSSSTCTDKDTERQRINKEKKKIFEVQSWKLLSDPRIDALQCAKQDDGSDGLMYSSYLKSRGLAFLRFNQDVTRTGDKDLLSTTRERNRVVSTSWLQESRSSPSAAIENFSHGNNQAKSLRARIFAFFLLETYGADFLASGNGVLDVAGGKGKVSIELSVQGNVQCTIVDPLVRKHGEKLEKRDAKRIRKLDAPHPVLLPREFNSTNFVDEFRHLLDGMSVIIGLHPDQPTEDILDVALLCDKPFAIIPCCVFPCFFPLRTLPCGSFVQSYDQFLEYLLLKDARLRRRELPFEGKNVVIYLPLDDD
jgi:hypothetical protein